MLVSIHKWWRPVRAASTLAVALAIAGFQIQAAAAERTPWHEANDPPPLPPAMASTAVPGDALAASDALFAEGFETELEAPGGDPLEPVNRKIFLGNRWLDRVIFDPVARFYGWAIPDPAKRSVRGVFENLNQPAVAVNDLLQREPRLAGSAGARFVVNTTIGLLGLWDPASRIGLEPHDADFGQTLGKAGVGAGPYLMLPVFGPSTSRDLVGSVVDLAMRPDTWLLPFGALLVLESTNGITRKEESLDSVSALEESSIDFYSTLRSAYLQSRAAMIESAPIPGALPAGSPSVAAGPDAPL